MKQSTARSLLAISLLALVVPACSDPPEESSQASRDQPELRKPPRAADKPPDPKKETVESLAEEFGRRLEEMNRAIARVRDTPSAESARSVVTRLSGEFVDLAERLQHLEVPPDPVKRRINQRMQDRQPDFLKSREKRLEFMRNLPDEAGEIVTDTLDIFRKTMTELHPVMSAYFEETQE